MQPFNDLVERAKAEPWTAVARYNPWKQLPVVNDLVLSSFQKGRNALL